MDRIPEELDNLARLRDLRKGHLQLLATTLSEKLPEAHDLIYDEVAMHEETLAFLDEQIATLEVDIKAGVMSAGFDATGSIYRATITPGRVTWDGRGLDKYAVAHPELSQFRRQGEAYVTIAPLRK